MQKEFQRDNLGNQPFRERNKSRTTRKLNEFDSKLWLTIKLLKLTTKDDRIVKRKVSTTVDNLEKMRKRFAKQLDDGREASYGWLFNLALPATVSLRSERGMNYKKLRDYLDAGMWKEADWKTAEIIKELFELEYNTNLIWVDDENLFEFLEKKFPREDLRTIDWLWRYYSNERFGFTVQKRIYEEEGENYVKLGKRVGWRNKENYGWVYEDNFLYDLNAPEGHLPVIFGTSYSSLWGYDEEGHGWRERELLFKRMEDCKM